MYLLDTDTFSNLLVAVRHYPHLRARVSHEPRSSLYISIVTVEEYLRLLLAAIHRDRSSPKSVMRFDALQQLLSQIAEFQILPFDEPAWEAFQRMPRQIRQHHPNDCRNAAIAGSRGLTIVTRNAAHFERIGVAHEDWTEG